MDNTSYPAMRKAIFLSIGLLILIWFLYQIVEILLLFFVAVVFGMAFNVPVTWLERKKFPRLLAAGLTFLLLFVMVFLLGWLVVPRIVTEVSNLIQNLPDYLSQLNERIASALNAYPVFAESLTFNEQTLIESIPSVPTLLNRFGRYTLSVIAVIAISLLIFSMVMYMVIQPRPLVKTYLQLFPQSKRENASRAFVKTSTMVGGWLWSNAILGSLEALFAGVFLSLIGIPGALVWAVLAFFSELVPRIGPYLMAVPPILVALSVDPIRALWVTVFYVAMNEVMSDFVMPRIRASTMKLHPVAILFAVLALGSAFGFVGALMATPFMGMIVAFYQEFYLAEQANDPDLEKQVEQMIRGKLSK